jgi:hypothetical protein
MPAQVYRGSSVHMKGLALWKMLLLQAIHVESICSRPLGKASVETLAGWCVHGHDATEAVHCRSGPSHPQDPTDPWEWVLFAAYHDAHTS